MTPRTTRWLRRRCSAPGTPSPISGAGPSLDPSYGQSALATYQELINRYPNTPAALKAKQRIADLEESFAKKEYKAAQFYLRLKAYDSAILYLRDLIATYPRTSLIPEALIKLIEVLQQARVSRGRRGDLWLSPPLPPRDPTNG